MDETPTDTSFKTPTLPKRRKKTLMGTGGETASQNSIRETHSSRGSLPSSVRSTTSSGKTRSWPKREQHIIEIACGLTIYTKMEKLNTEQIFLLIGLTFKNLMPISDNTNYLIRLKNVMAKSTYLTSDTHPTSVNSNWSLSDEKTFLTTVDNFVDENPEWAEEHNIKKASFYAEQHKLHKELKEKELLKRIHAHRATLTKHTPEIKSESDKKDEAVLNATPVAAHRLAPALFRGVDLMHINVRDIPLPNDECPSGSRRRKRLAKPSGEAAPAAAADQDEAMHVVVRNEINSEPRAKAPKTAQAEEKPLQKALILPKKSYGFSPEATTLDQKTLDELLERKMKDLSNPTAEKLSQTIAQMVKPHQELHELRVKRMIQLAKDLFPGVVMEEENEVLVKHVVGDQMRSPPASPVASPSPLRPPASPEAPPALLAAPQDVPPPMIRLSKSPDPPAPARHTPADFITNTLTGEKYSVVKFLASGGFGSVYEIKDNLQSTFAIKMSEGVPNDDEIMLSQTIAAATARGEHPPRFLTVPEYFRGNYDNKILNCEKMPLYTTDLFEAAFDHKIPFSYREVLQVIAHTCSALAYLHKQKFVYVDVKPDNIMLSKADVVEGKFKRIDTRLIDFNCVIRLDPSPQPFVGQSISYRSPEVALEINADFKVDVFALGLVALQLITSQQSNFFSLLADDDVRGLTDLHANYAILREIKERIGPIPRYMIVQACEFSYGKFDPRQLKSGLWSRNSKLTLGDICTMLERSGDENGHLLSSVCRRMTTVDPYDRPTAEELAHDLVAFTSPRMM